MNNFMTLLIILKAKLKSIILIQIKKFGNLKEKHNIAGLFSSIPVAPGVLRLPLSNQEMLVFASNIYDGHPEPQGFRGYGFPTNLSIQPCIGIIMPERSEAKTLYINIIIIILM